MKRPLPTAAETAEILGRKCSRPAHRPPPAAGKQLSGLVKALDARFGAGPGMLQARWREIVGEELARRTEPVKLSKPRGGGPAALELKVAPGAAVVVQHQAADVIARANLVLGKDAVGKLRIVQGLVKARALPDFPMRTALARRRTAPLDAAAEAELAAGLAQAKDEGLKAALTRLGRAVKRSS